MKKRKTLRQWLLIEGGLVSVACIVCSYVLAFLQLDTNAEVTLGAVGIFGGIYTAYLSADTMDHNSANKYGRKNDDV